MANNIDPKTGQPITPQTIAAQPIGTDISKASSNAFWDNALVGTYSVLNGVLMGLPDLLNKITNEDNYKAMKAYQAAHQSAANIGNTIGTIGGFLIPAGAVAKGAGLTAKGLGAVGLGEKLLAGADIIRGAKAVEGASPLVAHAAQGALAGAEQAIPRAVIGGATTGDWQQAGTEAALGVGGGAALGAALPAIAKKFSGFKKDIGLDADHINKALLDQQLASKGISGNDLVKSTRTWAKSQGLDPDLYMIKHGDEIKANLWNAIKDLHGEEEIKGAVMGFGPKYEAVEEAFMSKLDDLKKPSYKVLKPGEEPKPFVKGIGSYLKVSAEAADGSATIPSIFDSPEVQTILSEHGEDAQNLLEKMLKKLDDASSIGDAKKYLRKQMSDASKIGGKYGLIQGDTASAVYSSLNEHVLASSPEYQALNKEFAAIAPIRKSVAMDEMRISPLSTPGSDTAPKLAAMNLLGAGVGGSQGIGDVLQNPYDPNAWLGLAGKTAAGALLGNIGSRAVSKFGNIGAGKAASGIKKIEGLASQLGESKVGQVVNDVVSAAAPSSGVGAAKIAGLAATPTPAETNAEAQGQPAPVAGTPNMDEVNKTTTPAALPSDESPVYTSPRFQQTVVAKLQQDYLQHYRLSGISFQDFVTKVERYTNGFKDMSKVAEILYDDPEQQAKFVETYKKIEELKSIDLDKALAPSSLADRAGVSSGDKLALKNFLLKNAASEGKALDAKTRGEVNRFINSLSDQGRVFGNGMSIEDKKEAIIAFLNEHGVKNLLAMRQIGLV